MTKKPVIELRNVCMSFGKVAVHRDISFKIYPGETVTLLGPSGTGKTVILKLIIGLLHPTSGEILICDEHLPENANLAMFETRKNIGMLFQGAALFDSLNVYDNIAYGLHEANEKSEEEIAAIVKHSLNVIGLPGTEHKFPPELSGGQKKRISLARALASTPAVVLFDEPTTGLDPTAVRLIDDLILKLKHEYGITSIVVTHDIESARRVSDRWILIHNGSIVADGPVAEVSKNNPYVVDFVTGNWKPEAIVL